MRKQWVGATEPLPLMRQCELTGVARSTIYTPRLVVQPDEQEMALLTLIDAEYTRHPFYGSRKIVQYLQSFGHIINRKRVQRLIGHIMSCRYGAGAKHQSSTPAAQDLSVLAQRRVG
ncbi:MAG: transposase [Nitrosomonas sp.]|nr:transposase [Nitrosomonas sp.]